MSDNFNEWLDRSPFADIFNKKEVKRELKNFFGLYKENQMSFSIRLHINDFESEPFTAFYLTKSDHNAGLNGAIEFLKSKEKTQMVEMYVTLKPYADYKIDIQLFNYLFKRPFADFANEGSIPAERALNSLLTLQEAIKRNDVSLQRIIFMTAEWLLKKIQK